MHNMRNARQRQRVSETESDHREIAHRRYRDGADGRQQTASTGKPQLGRCAFYWEGAPDPTGNRGKPQLGRWAFYWEGVFGAAQNAECGKILVQLPCYPARLLWASGGHPRGQSRLIWVRQGPWVLYVEQAGRPAPEEVHSGSSSGAGDGDGAAHEDLGAYAAVAALVRLLYEPGAWQRARRAQRWTWFRGLTVNGAGQRTLRDY
eukprot:scaffold21556_cov120-Isochrysis_galbana.AAC.5